MNRCAKIKGCPASQYLSCRAYAESLDCWQISSPRCSADLRICIQYGCPVYERFKAEIENTLKERAMEPVRSQQGETA
jgi:hypothetical protein